MSRVRWIAMGFDKKTEKLVQKVELVGLQTDAVLKIVGLDDPDQVIGVSIDITPDRARALAPYANGGLDLTAADWFLEARAVNE